MSAGISYWTEDERRRLASHIFQELKKLLGDRPFLLWIETESVFVGDPRLKKLKASTQGGWSIWLRETFTGLPFDYNGYMETAIHEAAHAVAPLGHTHRDKEFRQAHARLRKEARRLGIWPKKEVPPEVKDLFDQQRTDRTRRILEDLLGKPVKGGKLTG